MESMTFLYNCIIKSVSYMILHRKILPVAVTVTNLEAYRRLDHCNVR